MTQSQHLEMISKKAAEYVLQGYGMDLAICKAFDYVNRLCNEMIERKTERSKEVYNYALSQSYEALK